MTTTRRRISARAGRPTESHGGAPTQGPSLLDAYVHRPRARAFTRVALPPPSVSTPDLRERQPLRVLSDARPRTRGECVDGPRPCPWVSCRHHLFLDLTEHVGEPLPTARILRTTPYGELDAMPETCSLDVADRGPNTLEQVGEVLGVSRERIRQIEEGALTGPTLRRVLREWEGHSLDADMARASDPEGVASAREALR